MSELVQLRAENERLREQFRRTKNPAADRAGGRPQGSPLRSAEIGAHGIKNLAMLGDAVRTPAAAMGWKNYYEAGRAGIAMERVGEIPGAPEVAPQVAFAAYSAGENDREAQAAPAATAVRQPKQDEAQTMGIQ